MQNFDSAETVSWDVSNFNRIKSVWRRSDSVRTAAELHVSHRYTHTLEQTQHLHHLYFHIHFTLFAYDGRSGPELQTAKNIEAKTNSYCPICMKDLLCFICLDK